MFAVASPRSETPRPPAALALLALVVALALVAVARSAHAGPSRSDDARAAPSAAAVVAAAYRAAGLDRDLARSWSRRARLAGLIPWLTVRTGRDIRWQSDAVSVDHDMAIDVRATWRLDRLAFDGRELQAASIEAARRRERRRLATHVIRTYYAWQRAARGACQIGGCDDATVEPGLSGDPERPNTRSRAQEAAAELDALTDGWFSESLRDHAAVRPKPGHPGRQ